VLYAQPVYRFGPEQQLAGAEALVRWHHPTLGRLMPDEFIPLAEETGTIVPIGRWVLQQSAAAVARWNGGRRSGLDPLVLAVNFSTRQFLMDDLIHAVEHALEANDCDPQWIVAEITENLLLEDSDSIQRILHHLRDRGIRIAIDDFGMGYSALHYLTRFPLDMLKIDRRFIEGVRVEREHDELVTALVAMAQALGLTVVAEGIETTEQFEFLVDRQCDFGQGFLLGKPAPLDQFEADHIL
jgi:EAL domain-containing protein (putative c-di-GMP-specific phosphodiesterase class I)